MFRYPTLEETRALQKEEGCGITTAKRCLMVKNLREAIKETQSLEELKELLIIMLDIDYDQYV